MKINNVIRSVFPYRQFLVGFSGGLDSTVLLHCLKIYRDQESDVKVRAIHVNHHLHNESDNHADHCALMCREWNIPFSVTHVAVINQGLGIEAHARNLRYEAFKKSLSSGESLVTAHHLNDQCETFFLALKRGSGPLGLSSMSKCANFSNTKLLRPLLNESRSSLVNWSKIYSLKWIEDKTNQDLRYDRNFLRLHIMPLLNTRWSNILFSIARSADLCREQESLLNELLSDELNCLITEKQTLQIQPLKKMSEKHRGAILRRWFLNQGAMMPSRSMLNRIWNEVIEARKDRSPCINLNNYEVRRFKGELWRIKSKKFCNKNTVIIWSNLYNPLILPNKMGKVFLRKGGNVIFPLSKESVSIRFTAIGIIHIVGRHRGCKLKKIWQEMNIPPWERSGIPLLFYNETLIAAAGKFITKEGWTVNGFYFEQDI